MRPAVWLLIGIAAIVVAEEPWVEEEDVEEPYDNEDYEHDTSRRRREVQYFEPEDKVRFKKKREYDNNYERVKRSEEYTRTPRQVHQYEVHEFTDDSDSPQSPPYEEMLAASANHYHRVYAEPGAPAAARYLRPDVSVPVNPVQYTPQPISNAAPDQTRVTFVQPPPKINPHVSPESVSNQAFKPVQPVSNVFVNPNPAYVNPNAFVGQTPSAAYVQAPVVGPVPVASVPLTQPLQQLAAGDQFGAAAGHKHHHHAHSHGHAQGGGHNKHADHHNTHGGKTVKGFNQDHHVDKGGKGYKTDEIHRKEYEEAQGKKKKHHDHADHKGSHQEAAHGQKGSHFDEKKGHKKGHKTKGYHNKYHKDEFHKEHKFYDDYHKSGEHHRYGKFNAKHASNESGKKKAHHVNAGHDYVERGKKGYSNKGHVDADHKGHKGKHGHEEHNEHHSEHGKKGAKEGGSHWGYQKN